jgi:hypothetical protein
MEGWATPSRSFYLHFGTCLHNREHAVFTALYSFSRTIIEGVAPRTDRVAGNGAAGALDRLTRRAG